MKKVCSKHWRSSYCSLTSSLSHTHIVITEVPPEIVRGPNAVTTTIGESVNLTCTATGVPTPKYEWFKDGKQIDNANLPYYYIGSVTPEDRGSYYCTAANNAGTDRSREVLLSLRGKSSYKMIHRGFMYILNYRCTPVYNKD